MGLAMKHPKQKVPLRFTHIVLHNWRNFTSVDADLSTRVFLVGPNASGKSNFLDAFRFLRDLASVGGGFQEAVKRRGGVSSLRSLAARRYPDIEIRVVLGHDDERRVWEYQLTFNQDKLRRPAIKSERVLANGETILCRPDEKDRNDPERLTQTYLEQVYTNQDFRAVAEAFASVRYLHVVPQLIREPDRSIGRTNDPFGGDFLERVARTGEKTRNAWLRRIRDAVAFAVPQLRDLELWRDVKGTPHLRGKYDHWRPQGAWQTEERLSDGTLRLIGLLWAVRDGSGPLLLEEPELSLHPEVVRHIPQMFARVQRQTGRQVLVSTHSVEILRDDGIGLDEVLLLLPAPEGTTVNQAAAFPEIVALMEGGCTLADAVIPQTRPKHAHQLTLFGE
jgi:predicted ATPase